MLILPRVGGALRAPRRQSLLRSQARCALLPAATPRMMGLRPHATRSTGASPRGSRRLLQRSGGLQLVAHALAHGMHELIACTNS